jgi:hypothetical protein
LGWGLYLGWPDHGVPTDIPHYLSFMAYADQIREKLNGSNGAQGAVLDAEPKSSPFVVQCRYFSTHSLPSFFFFFLFFGSLDELSPFRAFVASFAVLELEGLALSLPFTLRCTTFASNWPRPSKTQTNGKEDCIND